MKFLVSWFGLVAQISLVHANNCFAQRQIKPDASIHAVARTFAQALAPRTWQFPRDHGQHPEFRTEWWYFTGNLASQEGRRFGYQLTFFRTALLPEPVWRASRWAFRDAYIAHFALTDVEAEKFHHDQRVARGALNLAHAVFDSLKAHVGDWSMTGGNGGMQLKAESSFGSISFSLDHDRPPVLHGQNGLVRRGQQAGEASYYYSLPDLRTIGTLRLFDQAYQIEGVSWMDHEFFTGPEMGEAQGWDWMSLHLSDSTAIMLYLFRDRERNILPASGGTLIFGDGSQRQVRMSDFEVSPLSWWTSSKSGGKYPISWKLRIDNYQLELTTPVKNQELDTRTTTGVIYWEGYIEATGSSGGERIQGTGYLEMTGYAGVSKQDL